MKKLLSFSRGWLRQPVQQQSKQDAATNGVEPPVIRHEHHSLPNPNNFLEVQAYFKQRLQHEGFR